MLGSSLAPNGRDARLRPHGDTRSSRCRRNASPASARRGRACDLVYGHPDGSSRCSPMGNPARGGRHVRVHTLSITARRSLFGALTQRTRSTRLRSIALRSIADTSSRLPSWARRKRSGCGFRAAPPERAASNAKMGGASTSFGAIAQLGERVTGSHEVAGSSPASSTDDSLFGRRSASARRPLRVRRPAGTPRRRSRRTGCRRTRAAPRTRASGRSTRR